jgi:predicted metal-dependent hydrolase
LLSAALYAIFVLSGHSRKERVKMAVIKIDKVIRSKRRTIALEIGRDATLIVRAPESLSLDYIEKLVYKKRAWIEKKQERARIRYARVASREFVNGEEFLYLGAFYPLSIVAGTDIPLTLSNGREFRLSRDYHPHARQVFITWYKIEAYTMIKRRLGRYSALSGLGYNKFDITDARRRWGSCNTKGHLRLSWRLIMAPLRVIDYVIVHELVHLTEKNHSEEFWERVRIFLPEYKKDRKWLKVNGDSLFI